MQYTFSRFFAFILIISSCSLSSCDEDRNSAGYNYYPDMVDSRAYEAQSENPNFADGKTSRLPVKGTIPRGHMVYDFEKTEENRALIGSSLKNPFKMSYDDKKLGKAKFEIYCIICHGELGNGKGHLVTSGRYPYPAANLLSDKMRKA